MPDPSPTERPWWWYNDINELLPAIRKVSPWSNETTVPKPVYKLKFLDNKLLRPNRFQINKQNGNIHVQNIPTHPKRIIPSLHTNSNQTVRLVHHVWTAVPAGILLFAGSMAVVHKKRESMVVPTVRKTTADSFQHPEIKREDSGVLQVGNIIQITVIATFIKISFI